MIVRRNRGLGAFGDDDPCAKLDWEPWCDCRYANDPTLRVKCKTKPWSCCPVGFCPPWASPKSVVGQACRGIPKEGKGALIDIAYGVQTGMSFISMVDRIAVPMQERSIVAKETEVAVQQQQVLEHEVAEVRAIQQRKEIGEWVKYSAMAAGGLLAVIVVGKVLKKRKVAAAAAHESKKHRRVA